MIQTAKQPRFQIYHQKMQVNMKFLTGEDLLVGKELLGKIIAISVVHQIMSSKGKPTLEENNIKDQRSL